MARNCPNCLKPIHFWSNYSGYCSKQCRLESTTRCPNCGTVGLFKHNRLGCCSEECRCWYASALLGYDRDALLTPAPDKIVYHIRLPSNNAEISSLQLNELEYERRIGTVLVIASPAWMARHRVLAELPYERFDNEAWQHLLADGTLTGDEIERFRGYLYDEQLLHDRLGLIVYGRLRGEQGDQTRRGAALAGGPYITGATTRMLGLPAPATAGRNDLGGTPLLREHVPSHQLAGLARALFEGRGFAVAPTRYGDEELLVLLRNGRQARARYYWSSGIVDVAPIEEFARWLADSGIDQGYYVTNGHFSLQAEDWASARPIQLIDGTQLRSLLKDRNDPFLQAKQDYDGGRVAIEEEHSLGDQLSLGAGGADPVTGETRSLSG